MKYCWQNYKYRRTIVGLTFLASLSLAFLAPQAGFAQGKDAQVASTKSTSPGAAFGAIFGRSQNTRREPLPAYKVNEMDREITLPNVPSFTGRQVFIEGLQYPNQSYHLNYSTVNGDAEVLEWWKAALNGGSWKVTYSNTTAVRAQAKDGSICSVMVTGPSAALKAKGTRGGYSIYYSPPRAQ